MTDSALRDWQLERHALLDSTNEEVRRRAFAGDCGNIWIVADQQTAGRGRQGRAWHSSGENFHGSALLIDPCVAANIPQIGFVAGLAVRAALCDLDVPDVCLKWPNDVVACGAKLGGILLEAWSHLPHGRSALCVGVGVNLVSHPADLPYPATDASRLKGETVALKDFIPRLVLRFDEVLRVFARGEGFEIIRRQWLAVTAGLGRGLCVHTPQGVREGLFEGLDRAGHLLLRCQGQIETIRTADIVLSKAYA